MSAVSWLADYQASKRGFDAVAALSARYRKIERPAAEIGVCTIEEIDRPIAAQQQKRDPGDLTLPPRSSGI